MGIILRVFQDVSMYKHP